MIRNFFQLSQRSLGKGIDEREKIITFFFILQPQMDLLALKNLESENNSALESRY